MTLKLYGSPRNRAGRVIWMLEEIGADYEVRDVDLEAEGQRGAGYASVNPQRKLPALSKHLKKREIDRLASRCSA